MKKLIKQIIEEEMSTILESISINESAGQEPTKEQIDATFDLLKTVLANTPFAGKVFVAGGAVRDMIMGLDPKDIDVVVEMEAGGIKFAEFLARRLGVYKHGSNPVVFETFGTAKVSFDGVVHKGIALDGVDVESVNTREEEYEAGSRKPTTKFGTIKGDVFRRDLTINSLLMDLMSGEILDLTGHGRSDIEKGVIRTPSEPNRIFQDDPLRLLRAVRFAGRYTFSMPDFMKKAIKNNAMRLGGISAERIREEMEKILKGNNPEVGIKFMYDLDLMDYALPQLVGHEADALAGASSGTGVLEKFILMLKNIPFNDVKGIGRQLKFSNEEASAITETIKAMQDIERSPTEETILKSGTTLFNKNLERFIPLLNSADSKVKGLSRYFNNGPVVHVPPNELMSVFGLKPGPSIGKLVQMQKNEWYKNPEISKKEMLDKIGKEIG